MGTLARLSNNAALRPTIYCPLSRTLDEALHLPEPALESVARDPVPELEN